MFIQLKCFLISFNSTKRLIYVGILVGFIACAPSSTTDSNTINLADYSASLDFSGTWDFITKNTPMGDYKGDLILRKEQGEYVGLIIHNELKFPMEGLKIEGNHMSFRLNYEGYRPLYEGTIEGDVFNGHLTIRGSQFEIAAIKKSSNVKIQTK